MTSKRDYVEVAINYALGVINGEIPAGEYVKRACFRQLNDLENGVEGFTFDYSKAVRVCKFIECLKHIKGKWAGTNITLEPWQIFILTTIFGWVDSCGKRRFKTAYIEVARKNGKSALASGVALYLLCADGEGGPEVYSAATAKDQARIVWQDSHRMVERNPDLQAAFGVRTTAHTIEVKDNAAVFKALSRDQGGNLDGLNVHGAIVDELHGHKTRDIWDVLETATGAREQPLIFAITTAGFNRSGICYEVRDYLTKILARSAVDEEFFGIIYSVDKEDDWVDESTWMKANPNLGVSVSIEDLRRKCRKAIEQVSAQNNFLTKHLNLWVNAEVAWMDMRSWDAVGDPGLTIEEVAGWDCWLAVDLASKRDIASIGLIFYNGLPGDEKRYAAFTRNFLPSDTIRDSKNSQYEGWAKQGFLIPTEGNVTDYQAIEDEIISLAGSLNVKAVCFDPFQATYIMTRLIEKGLPVEQYGNTVKNMSEPMKELEALIISGKLNHSCDPVLTWMMSNVCAKEDVKENIFPRKEFPENKIDGVVALIMALGKAISDIEDSESIYEERGILTI